MGLTGSAGLCDYTASKAAVNAFHESCASLSIAMSLITRVAVDDRLSLSHLSPPPPLRLFVLAMCAQCVWSYSATA